MVAAGVEVEGTCRNAWGGRAGGRDPNPGCSGAEAGRHQQRAHALALARVAEHDELETTVPAARAGAIDVLGGLPERGAPLLGEVIEAVAPDAAALQPAVGRQPR